MNVRIFILAMPLLTVAGRGAGQEAVGERPYEMDWAERTADIRPPLVDFEDVGVWSVECRDATAVFARSREQQLWGKYVGKLVYRGQGNAPSITLRLKNPVPVPQPFDCVNMWIYGNNWEWAPDPSTPPVAVEVLLRSRAGREVRVPLGNVRWKEWWVMHRRLTPDQLAALEDGAFVVGLHLTGCRNREDRLLYFDNLALYQEQLPPLRFEPRPARGVAPFPGQSAGTNTGPGTLPFPTREETILPDNLAGEFTVRLEESADGYTFRYRGPDGQLVYRYRPATGTLGDVTVEWAGGQAPFQPLAEGGVFFQSGSSAESVAPETVELLSCERVGETVVSTWQCRRDERTVELTYTLRLWQKSLVIDSRCPGGHIGELSAERTWWLKAETTFEELASLSAPFLSGQRLRGGQEEPLQALSGARVATQNMSCGGAAKDGIFMHPPYKNGVGFSFALLPPVDLPAEPKAAVRCQIGKRDGSDPGDGILFRIAVVDRDSAETVVAEQQWIKHGWSPLEANLAAWAGQSVRIKLICDVGPEDNSAGDWGCWAELRLELELADGRKCSSQVTTAIVTQPPDWLYAEGTAVPFGKDIELEIKFPLEQ